MGRALPRLRIPQTLKVDPRKTAVLLERLGTAVSDQDAFAEIGA